MPITYIGGIVGLVLGSFGYVIFRFWFIPIFRYNRLKHRIVKNIDSYYDSINTGWSNDLQIEGIQQKAADSRRFSTELTTFYHEKLPRWYKLLMSGRGESPIDASTHLMGLANTRNFEHVRNRIEKVLQFLNME